MGIFRRRAPKPEAEKPDGSAERPVHGRIEVTVEREWVSLLVRGKPAPADEAAGRQESEPGKAILEGGRREDPGSRGELGDGTGSQKEGPG